MALISSMMTFNLRAELAGDGLAVEAVHRPEGIANVVQLSTAVTVVSNGIFPERGEDRPDGGAGDGVTISRQRTPRCEVLANEAVKPVARFGRVVLAKAKLPTVVVV